MTAVTAFLSGLIKALGLPICVLIVFYVYEEGIPGASRLALPASWPIVGGFGLVDIPVIGDLTTGRVHTYAANQVTLALSEEKSRERAKLESMVSGAELAAANARTADLEQQIERAQQIKDQAEKDAANMDLKAKDAQDALDQRIEADDKRLATSQGKGDNRARFTAADIEWLYPKSH